MRVLNIDRVLPAGQPPQQQQVVRDTGELVLPTVSWKIQSLHGLLANNTVCNVSVSCETIQLVLFPVYWYIYHSCILRNSQVSSFFLLQFLLVSSCMGTASCLPAVNGEKKTFLVARTCYSEYCFLFPRKYLGQYCHVRTFPWQPGLETSQGLLEFQTCL